MISLLSFPISITFIFPIFPFTFSPFSIYRPIPISPMPRWRPIAPTSPLPFPFSSPLPIILFPIPIRFPGGLILASIAIKITITMFPIDLSILVPISIPFLLNILLPNLLGLPVFWLFSPPISSTTLIVAHYAGGKRGPVPL